jgi:aminomethyltransferase
MTATLAQTPLYEWHAAHGGRMVDFAGWSMPVQYSSIVAEHTATRTAAGLFDISHMGRIRFDGADAAKFINSLVTRDLADLKPGGIRYALVTNDQGGVKDDVLVYHLQDAAGGSYYLLVVNASNRPKIVEWIDQRLAACKDDSARRADASTLAGDVSYSDLTHEWAMIAVQGPAAVSLAQPLVDEDIAALKYYTGLETRIAGHGGIVSRTGYTGEDGVELIVGSGVVERIWASLLEAGRDRGVLPCGLGARDTLRLEAGMPLYGHELNEELNPLQAGLKFAVSLDKAPYPGREAMRQISNARAADDPSLPRLVGLELEGKRPAREGHPILAEGQRIGHVTSGTFSPTFQKPIAMGYVAPSHAKPGARLQVDIRGQLAAATVVRLPFYRRSG